MRILVKRKNDCNKTRKRNDERQGRKIKGVCGNIFESKKGKERNYLGKSNKQRKWRKEWKIIPNSEGNDIKVREKERDRNTGGN